jgi:hypothetical protein
MDTLWPAALAYSLPWDFLFLPIILSLCVEPALDAASRTTTLHVDLRPLRHLHELRPAIRSTNDTE